jgi:hypothetical protein
MSATLAVDILVGAFQLSPAQQRVLRESQGYVRGGTKVNAATRRVLVRLGLIEASGRGHTTTAWGDAIGEELVARQAAQGEYLPEILWKDSKGWLDGDRFQLVIHGPQSYALDDTQGRVGQVLKTLVHAQQLVREILAEEAREADAAHEEAYGDGFDQPQGAQERRARRAQRQSKAHILRQLHDDPPHIADMVVLATGAFRPGGDGVYASIMVLLERDGSPFGHERRYATSEMIRIDDRETPVWSSQNGHYDMTFAEAEKDLEKR